MRVKLGLRPQAAAPPVASGDGRGLVVVSGCPGSGKTTVCRALASGHPRGVHIESDLFYGFLADPIAPIEAAAHTQNATVLAAVAAAAAAYRGGGYGVFVVGVVGPGFVNRIRDVAGAPVDYVVLRAGLDETIRRGTSRSEPVTRATILAMHPQFADLGDLEGHGLDTDGAAVDTVVAEVRDGLSAGRFRLGL